jgi:hypothetical protein
MEAASEIQDMEVIFDQLDYVCRSIVSQLVRMYCEGFNKNSVVCVENAAILDKKMAIE